MHRIAHYLKKGANLRYDDVVFSDPGKSSRVCSAVERLCVSQGPAYVLLTTLIGMWPAAWRWSSRYHCNSNGCISVKQDGL